MQSKVSTTYALAMLLLLPCAGLGQTPQPASAPPALTMQQVVDLARAKNPTLLSAQQNLLSIKAQEIQAGVRANPYFTFAGTNVTLPAEGASNPYAYSLQVSRLFERGEKRRWRLDTARSTTAQTIGRVLTGGTTSAESGNDQWSINRSCQAAGIIAA